MIYCEMLKLQLLWRELVNNQAIDGNNKLEMETEIEETIKKLYRKIKK